MNESEKAIIRPRLDENLVYQIKAKYWSQTKDLSNEETITWALKKFIETTGTER